MKRLIVLLALSGCAPLSPSTPKSQLCSIPSEYMSRYNSAIINSSSWSEVPSIMGEQPLVQGDTQTYYHCQSMVFVFSGSVLVDKYIE